MYKLIPIQQCPEIDALTAHFNSCWQDDDFKSFVNATIQVYDGTDKDGAIYTVHSVDIGDYWSTLIGITGYVPLYLDVIALRWTGVLPKHQRKGHGKLMLETLAGIVAEQRNLRNITLYEQAYKPETKAWFKRLGFRVASTKQEVLIATEFDEQMGKLPNSEVLLRKYYTVTSTGMMDLVASEDHAKKSDLPKAILDLADKYGVKVIRAKEAGNNQASCAGNAILMDYFDDPDLELVAFFHELGHIQNNRNSAARFCLSKLANEGAAWETAMHLATIHGYQWPLDYHSKEQKYARECLSSYYLTSEDEDRWLPADQAPFNELLYFYEPHDGGGFQFVGMRTEEGIHNNLDVKQQYPSHYRLMFRNPTRG
jgi:GNAT superfamily N-acetyltransferase